MKIIYIEDEVLEHPRVASICERFPGAVRVSCARYTEVFNSRAQNFRLQKRNPSLVLAAKRGELLHRVPEGYGLGGDRNYYFSHMFNCVYD